LAFRRAERLSIGAVRTSAALLGRCIVRGVDVAAAIARSNEERDHCGKGRKEKHDYDRRCVSRHVWRSTEAAVTGGSA
jgi:hypothetical protein